MQATQKPCPKKGTSSNIPTNIVPTNDLATLGTQHPKQILILTLPINCRKYSTRGDGRRPATPGLGTRVVFLTVRLKCFRKHVLFVCTDTVHAAGAGIGWRVPESQPPRPSHTTKLYLRNRGECAPFFLSSLAASCHLPNDFPGGGDFVRTRKNKSVYAGCFRIRVQIPSVGCGLPKQNVLVSIPNDGLFGRETLNKRRGGGYRNPRTHQLKIKF